MNKQKEKIVMFYPFVTEDQRQAVYKVLGTRWIGQGPKCDEFEKQFAEKFSIPHAISVNSGSAALETACDLLALKSGDKVIATPLTCTATNLPLVRRKIKILWADINPETLNMSQESVDEILHNNQETEYSNAVQAIFNVHLGGIESKIGGAARVIDDACQAIGIYRPEAWGTCFSFQAIKHFTTGDGGMFCTNMEDMAKQAKLLRWFGIDREKKVANNWDPMNDREMVFDIELPGHKRHMNDIAAAMGLEGLKAYDAIVKKRRQIFETYASIRAPGFQLINPKGVRNVFWTAATLVERRNDFRRKLLDYNIETNVVQVRNDIYKIFGGQRAALPNLNALEEKIIYIPLQNLMTLEDAQYIKDVIQSGW